MHQKVMEDVLVPVLNSYIHIYFGDIIITWLTFSDHLNHLRQVFELLQQMGLILKMDKCKFGKNEIQYHAFRLTGNGVCVDDSKTTAIKTVPPPNRAKEFATL